MSIKKRTLIVILVVLFCGACAKSHHSNKNWQPKGKPFYKAEGLASWYGKHLKGRNTANGEKFDPEDMTAAHRTLPFNTMVKVTNISNQKSVWVRINDRGPASHKRLIDLAHGAAAKLGYLGSGLTKVEIEAYRE